MYARCHAAGGSQRVARYHANMSDLQCPATFVLLAPESLPALDAKTLRVAGVFVYGHINATVQAELQRVAAAHGCEVQQAGEAPDATLLSQIEALADVYRGETVLMLATSSAVCAALRRTSPPAQPVTLAVDNDGARVLSD